ncbi:hypothetical protein HYPBUDRAFT_153700 [Hyphopichia burtonii NRRL Y-1933]|uniref:TauD/TfdA-like domain-containing protein n=1 Tax=Hyphopichia burtonii NRRL Y-1933 TaxID=984485 RepID=A0A1E4RG84_9ASCO|nr:hypothetical protein HYPBUDRAFT_153700 [Hyphopichia burtonii NRRL Y-1933]ODV66258.1 hypothetical protein HYPBUDRAFT_153700 [Hyphopichia burtonii NRRL Y-1933]
MAPVTAASIVPREHDNEIDQTVRKLVSLKPLGHGSSNNAPKAGTAKEWVEKLPGSTRRRFQKHGIDLSKGYPIIPNPEDIPTYVDEAFEIRNTDYPFEDRAKFADPKKEALFKAAKEVKHLTKFVGTELVGLQLSELTDKQRDELALLVAERVVVFFKDQDISPQKQLEIGRYWGQIERHPQAPYVPLSENITEDSTEDLAKGSGITTVWRKFFEEYYGFNNGFKNRQYSFHTDVVHERNPASYTSLTIDAFPKYDGDTIWASGYGAYDKLLPAFQAFLDGKTAIFRSAHTYLDRENPLRGPKYIEREHPLVFTHPVTGWKSLYVNRSMTVRIVGLEPDESKTILEFLFNVYEKNLDIQVRFHWQPNVEGLQTTAIWDNRISQHVIIPFDEHDETEKRHGTRVITLGPVKFDPNSKSQRESLELSSN